MRFYVGKRIGGMSVGASFGREDFALFGSGRGSSSSVDGFVYVINRADGHVKVGTTRNPPQRIRTLQTGSALPLSYAYVAGTSGSGEDVETEAHRLLNRFHLKGDWFEASPEVAIAALNTAAARKDRSLFSVNAEDAERRVPPMPRKVFGPAERRRGNRNMAIVAFALLGGIMGGVCIWNFIQEANLGTVYNPLPGGVVTRP